MELAYSDEDAGSADERGVAAEITVSAGAGCQVADIHSVW
jgi:hypothetical protein